MVLFVSGSLARLAFTGGLELGSRSDDLVGLDGSANFRWLLLQGFVDRFSSVMASILVLLSQHVTAPVVALLLRVVSHIVVALRRRAVAEVLDPVQNSNELVFDELGKDFEVVSQL